MIEYRYLRGKDAGTAPKTEGRTMSGLAAPFNSVTTIGGSKYGFREKIAPGAFKKSISEGDVVLLDNHDSSKPLARTSAGTLDLSETKPGLAFEATPANTTYANDALENARAGNYGGMSFGFEVVRDQWTRGEEGQLDERTLLEVKVREISVCTFPAYDDTNVSARDQLSAAMECREDYFERTMRAKYSADELKRMLAKGQAFKNSKGEPSYPIGDTEDLANAIHAVGRGGSSHDAIRKYIIGRAKALGASKSIPSNWASDGSIKANADTDTDERITQPEGDTVQLDGVLQGKVTTITLSATAVADRAALETDIMMILANGEFKPQERCEAILYCIASGIANRNLPAAEEGTEESEDKTSEGDSPETSEPDNSTRTDDEMKDALRRAKLRMLSR